MTEEHDWYTNDLWRDSFLEEAVRSLSKLGTLEPHEAIFRELSEVLPKPEVVQLYLVL